MLLSKMAYLSSVKHVLSNTCMNGISVPSDKCLIFLRVSSMDPADVLRIGLEKIALVPFMS